MKTKLKTTEKMTRVAILIPTSVVDEMRRRTEETGIPTAWQVRTALKKHLATDEMPESK